MNIPNFKDILQKLSVFKNNLPLLLSVIIVLIALLLLIPTQLMSSKLKEEIQTNSVAVGDKVRREIKDAVSSEGWIEEEERQREHAKDANEIAVLAERSAQRELLSYDIFLDPNISSTLVFQEFGQRYREAIDDILNRANAGDCPTEAEIERGLEESAVNSRLRRGRSYGGNRGMGRSLGVPSVRPLGMPSRGLSGSRGLLGRSRRLGELERMIVDEICRERAKSISVYANPVDLSGYDFWADYKLAIEPNQAIEDCWHFQLAYWIITDIFDTISAVNSEYDSVLTAPVKRLMQMSFNMGLRRPGTGMRFRRGGRRSPQKNSDEVDKPTYVVSVDDGLTISCTGRVSNDANNIDVIHFNVTVVLDIKSILPFMQQLCSAKKHKFRGFSGDELEQTFKHNQITVLETKFRSVDEEPYSLYDYGEDPVVELDLICEYIFNKKGYEEIKPETVTEKQLKAAEEANSTDRSRPRR
jgi:hypothetical protein